ncbi:TPA: DUF3368 domain-containing protein, partial [Candidatus Bathyarchaeota archaeon]|nr:DUF3368 domain-containing protein [Candidatus Bathyarchaeota archaeon]
PTSSRGLLASGSCAGLDEEARRAYPFLDENPKLDVGEAESIRLARQFSGLLIVDDAGARTAAKIAGLTPLGTLGVLARAHREGLIQLGGLERCVADLLASGFRVVAEVYREVLARAKEYERRG